MATVSSSNSLAEMLVRAIEQADQNLTPDVARYVLSIQLPADDRRRMDELASAARSGALSLDDKTELDEYHRFGRLMEILRLKARHALNQSGQN
jgi:hypothetical protein